jgi:hypothetical protein
VFWLLAGAKCWSLNERAHREALGKQVSPPAAETKAATPVSAALLVTIGEWLFLCFFFYVPLANNLPQLRLAPFWEEILSSAGLAGAALVWVVSVTFWIINIGKTLMTFACRLGREPAQKQMPTHTTLGPVNCARTDRASPALGRYRACLYAGTSLLLCTFVLSSPLAPFPGAGIFNWMAYVGVGILLIGVGFAAQGSYAESLQTSRAGSEVARDQPVVAELKEARPLPFWVVVLIAGIVCASILKLLGIW